MGELRIESAKAPKKLAWLIGMGIASATLPALAQTSSIAEAGIDALRLHKPPYNLLGRKIALGQVEIGRPGQFGVDKAVSHGKGIAVTRVFQRNNPAKPNTNVDAHAQQVAAVMIGNNKAMRGVAPAARLYASAVANNHGKNRQAQECLATQHVALQNGGDVRAINFSFGEPLSLDPRPNPILDGNALLTQCVDWSARVHDVLYVIAGNQGKGGIPIPTDNYNGINVAFSTLEGGVYARVDVNNLGSSFYGFASHLTGIEGNIGGRRAIGLVAPGREIQLLNLNGNLTRATGTSFATPHVTATVALLQEYGDRQLRSRAPNWSLDARRHEVMKVVLLNSAEKIKDNGDGLRLGMTRTVVDKEGRDWLSSDAYHDPSIPLQVHSGTGHLNAFRAYQQFSAGQWSPTALVPPIGWDYRSVSSPNYKEASNPSFQEYILEKPLQQGGFVAVTLAWDRLVELEDKNNNGEYDIGEEFRDRGLNNLDLYLMRVEDDNPAASISSSISAVDSIEHIFFPIPQTARYKIRVQFRQQVNQPTQPYALAWWTVPAR
ncbi:MAG: S8 family serine peptidase [Oscillatoriaceae bacterium SKW80]|nr:S8 family serine peptidase [Oscillatoriaceae bacterium SKYG93]MCX8121283.1 S8 family serine peptidase [Oscillatoriaceae bacterium SKW80]MDW8453383.1 S8 family serine peptidase [Oscillatoriaceae cyanobacterium SKYGB_i_bin93]HIK26738.1 S8 family serine peptidase [Oscillatoriaceae cyanobacterium M7585_C2015_266]